MYIVLYLCIYIYTYILIYTSYTILYIYVWANYNDLTVLPNPGIMVNKGNHPKMAARFSLVYYYDLSSVIEI